MVSTGEVGYGRVMDTLFTEVRYRGYRLYSDTTTAGVEIWSGRDLIESSSSITKAKKLVDDYLKGN